MQLLRTPQAYTNWVAGPWLDLDSPYVPIQEALLRNPYAPIRGRDGQRMPYMAHSLSTNYLVPAMGYNVPHSAQIMGVQRYLAQTVDHKKQLRVKGFESNVPAYTWTGLSALQRAAANQ
jgi:hypothetical protein